MGKGGQKFFTPENYKNHRQAPNGSTTIFTFSLETLQGCKTASATSVWILWVSWTYESIVSHTVVESPKLEINGSFCILLNSPMTFPYTSIWECCNTHSSTPQFYGLALTKQTMWLTDFSGCTGTLHELLPVCPWCLPSLTTTPSLFSAISSQSQSGMLQDKGQQHPEPVQRPAAFEGLRCSCEAECWSSTCKALALIAPIGGEDQQQKSQ